MVAVELGSSSSSSSSSGSSGADVSSRLKADKGVAMVRGVLLCLGHAAARVAHGTILAGGVAAHARTQHALPASSSPTHSSCCRTITIPTTRNHQKLQKAAFERHMLLMPSGARESIRFLPPLNISAAEIDTALDKVEGCCKAVFG
jgi:hypothetical protein